MAPSTPLVERPAATGFRSTTRPDTSQTNKTLRHAAIQTLCISKSPRTEEGGCLSDRTALNSTRALLDSLAVGSPGSRRCAPPTYASLGEYRPAVQDNARPAEAANAEFQKMLEMIGEKCRQKFSKAREVFRFIDSDHSGSIDRSEVHYFFRFFNVSMEKADKFFEEFEKDDEGEIAYVEFVKYLWPHVNPGNEQVHWSLAKDERAKEDPDNAKAMPIYARRDEAEMLELPRDLVRARANIVARLALRYKNSRDAFRDLDYDKDGTITLEETQSFFRRFGWESVAEKFYNILIAKGHGEAHFDTFAGIFSETSDTDRRLRL